MNGPLAVNMSSRDGHSQRNVNVRLCECPSLLDIFTAKGPFISYVLCTQINSQHRLCVNNAPSKYACLESFKQMRWPLRY